MTAEGVKMDSGVMLPVPSGHKARPGQRVVLGIRPEHFIFGQGVKATINVTEPTGPEIHVYAELGGQEICAITSDRIGNKRGDDILLAPRLDKVHLFDAESGKALR